MSKEYAVLTYSGIHYLVDNEQAVKIASSPKDSAVDIEGNILKIANVSDIITIEKYYKEFPKKMEEARIPEYKNYTGLGFEGIIRNTNSPNALKNMIKGLKGYITSKRYQGGEEPTDLLKLMENKLRLIELNLNN